MSLNPPPGPARPQPARLPLAWALAFVLVAAAATAVVTASVTSHPSSTGSVTLTDDFGRKVSVAPHPTRVVALGASIVDLLAHLGLREHLVGVDCYTGTSAAALALDYTPSQIAQWNLSAGMCVEAAPFVATSLANLTPDLVLASTIVSIAAVESATDQLGIPLVVLQPTTLGGILVDDTLVGEIFGEEGAAASLNGRLSSVMANTTNVTSVAASFPTVLVTYSVDQGGYWTYGPGSFGASLVEFCGGAGIGALASTAYPELTPLQVLAAQPEKIVYASGFGLDLSVYEGGPDWSSFSAVQNGSVYGVDSTYLTEPDPTMILSGVPSLLAVLQPGSG